MMNKTFNGRCVDNVNHHVCGHDLGTLLLPLFPREDLWNVPIRGITYFLTLCYFFIGVAIASDIFMSSIEFIVSKSKTIPFNVAKLRGDLDQIVDVEVRVWNPTVANLTLMALGSSAPEILLSVIETCSSNFTAREGDLGPGTIVGSAAFNLLFITAVCVIYVPKGETRRIKIYTVFVITTMFSLFAYIWLLLVLDVISPNRVDLWEALFTLFCFPLLVIIAWWADNNFCVKPKANLRKSLVDKATEIMGVDEEFGFKKDNPLYVDGKVNPAALINFYKEIRENSDITDEEAASLVAYKLVQTRKNSRLWYRMGACRALMGSAKIQPILSEKLQHVYSVINDYNKKPGMPPGGQLSVISTTPEILQQKAVFEFQAASFAVPENIGTINVTIVRTGKSDNEVVLRVVSIDGTAKQGTDYDKVDTLVVFEPFVTERTVPVQIIDDNQWEPEESFFLRLSLTTPGKDDAMLGTISTMEIVIMDDDNPGELSFVKRGMLVSETTRKVKVEVARTNGCDGVIAVNWRTIPDTSGVKAPNAMTGKLTFQHGEMSKFIIIPLFQENNEDQQPETFDVVLEGKPEGGAKLGKMVKCSVTISDAVAFEQTVSKVVGMAAKEMDIIGSGSTTIRQQLIDAFQVGDGENVSATAYVMHFFSMPWKVLLALIPPPRYLGGWLCFVISLMAIGIQTAIIGDIATILGCILRLKPTITAITFVALGTSLPDTFASMAAAAHDDSADNAIGNVTGSNSVNVFLGLGLPWTLASIVNLIRGKEYTVNSGSLAFSVLVYSVIAIAAVGLLTARRYMPVFGKAELGGPMGPKIFSAILFVLFWIIYVLISALEAYCVIGTISLQSTNNKK